MQGQVAVVGGALAVLLLAGAARAAPPWQLRRAWTPGARTQVEEVIRLETEQRWQGRHATLGNAQVEQVVRHYIEDVQGPETTVREFSLATRARGRPGEEPPAERSSLDGRTVRVSGLEVAPLSAFEVSKDDREVLRYDRLAEALLPAGAVAQRESWGVPGDRIARALFGAFVDAANHRCAGRGELVSVRRVEGREVATLRVQAQVKLLRSETLPGLDLQLAGELRWDVAAGVLLQAQLEGPVSYELRVRNDEADGVLTSSGTARWSYRATVLEAKPVDAARARGEPPPRGCRALACGAAEPHRYELDEVRRCTACGRELDLERRCPDGHPWPLQFCPRDGLPLAPAD